MSQPFVGPTVPAKPDPHLPAQPSFNTWCVGWGAYDVPRIFDILQPNNDEISWGQAAGFRELTTLLLDRQTALRIQRDQLAAVWHGPAAGMFLSRIDFLSDAMLSDAHCASATASAIDSIMTAYVQARERVKVLHDCWNDTTTRWLPRWWDDSSAELNKEAQNLMYAVDDAVRDHRSRIVIPNEQRIWRNRWAPVVWQEPAPPPDDATAAAARTVVPPIPGYDPIEPSPSGPHPSNPGNGLAGMPRGLDAVPGQPVSMLPIPPGSSYAPYGGAYILPGPGVGPKGRLIPMPQQGYGMQIGRPLPAGTTPNSASMGFMPAPISSPQANARDGTQRVLYRRGAEVWRVETGVAPIIEAPDEDTYIPGQPSESQERAFHDWFTDLAHPWRKDADNAGPQPTVYFRKAEQ